ncbi:hypothetical protein LUZ60_009173 [Juncus effusus]|nr:hypothetical protein LUZ60_009173 [Juncus effusus]
MEYWSVEVKPGETIKVDPEDKYVHLSQVCRRESKKPEDVQLFVKINGQKEEFGTLNQGKYQIKYDVVFEKEFELSNASKNTSVYFRGYKVVMGDDGDDEMFDSLSEEDSEEEPAPKPVPIKLTTVNGKPKLVEEKPKNEKSKAVKKAEASKPKPMELDEDSEDDSDDDESEGDEDDSDNEEPVMKVKDDEDSEDDSEDDEDESGSDEEDDESDDEEEEATPQKVEVGKKRGKEQKTPTQDKKAKLVSPAGTQKTDGKKGGHVATPHPAKQAPKTPAAASNDKSKTPKSAGSVPCKSCNKMFNSENALQSHTKAKHA